MTSFAKRIESAAEKKSRIVVALDPPASQPNLQAFATKIIDSVQAHVCAVKINLHLILPLSAPEISQINRLAHSYGLQAIADIKLNDIENTNEVAVDHLSKAGFDAVIANPFIGQSALSSLVQKAHKADAGVIALVYMSHPGASEGYGLKVGNKQLYEIFMERAAQAGADGIVVGATQPEILKQASRKKMPIYSPGIGVQGGDIEQAVRSGASYLIIGRSIVQAAEPDKIAKEIQSRIMALGK